MNQLLACLCFGLSSSRITTAIAITAAFGKVLRVSMSNIALFIVGVLKDIDSGVILVERFLGFSDRLLNRRKVICFVRVRVSDIDIPLTRAVSVSKQTDEDARVFLELTLLALSGEFGSIAILRSPQDYIGFEGLDKLGHL
jgi:hypothetical protein